MATSVRGNWTKTPFIPGRGWVEDRRLINWMSRSPPTNTVSLQKKITSDALLVTAPAACRTSRGELLFLLDNWSLRAFQIIHQEKCMLDSSTRMPKLKNGSSVWTQDWRIALVISLTEVLRMLESQNFSTKITKEPRTIPTVRFILHSSQNKTGTAATKLDGTKPLLHLHVLIKNSTRQKKELHMARHLKATEWEILTKRLKEQTTSANQSHSFGFMHASRSFHSSLPSSGFCKRNGMLANLQGLEHGTNVTISVACNVSKMIHLTNITLYRTHF